MVINKLAENFMATVFANYYLSTKAIVFYRHK